MSRRRNQVPVTARLLAVRPLRTGVGIVGIGLALMLMLLLSGLWTGVQERVTVYDHLGADLAVVPPGTRSLFADPGVLPAAAAARIERIADVTDASLIRTMYLILELPHGKVAVAAVGSEPDGPGGPCMFAEGRAPAGDDEVALDVLFADQHGLGLGQHRQPACRG